MKKMIKLLPCLLCLILLLSFTACDNSDNDPFTNFYNGKSEEFTFTKWYSGEQMFNVSVEEGVTKVSYVKPSGLTYASVSAEVKGKLSNFGYVNFIVTSSKDVALLVRLGDASSFFLEHDAIFRPDETERTYSYKITNTNYLDDLDAVHIYPDPGLAGMGFAGNFEIKRAWFSKEMPQGAKHVNDPITFEMPNLHWVGQWSNDVTWTGYQLQETELGEVRIIARDAAEWAIVNRKLEWITEVTQDCDQYIKIRFTNEDASITRLRFYFRADRSVYVDNDPRGIEYWLYYEYRLGDYSYTQGDELVEIVLPIEMALKSLHNNMKQGINLTIFIESHPTQSGYDGNGSLIIHSVETFK